MTTTAFQLKPLQSSPPDGGHGNTAEPSRELSVGDPDVVGAGTVRVADPDRGSEAVVARGGQRARDRRVGAWRDIVVVRDHLEVAALDRRGEALVAGEHSAVLRDLDESQGQAPDRYAEVRAVEVLAGDPAEAEARYGRREHQAEPDVFCSEMSVCRCAW